MSKLEKGSIHSISLEIKGFSQVISHKNAPNLAVHNFLNIGDRRPWVFLNEILEEIL